MSPRRRAASRYPQAAPSGGEESSRHSGYYNASYRKVELEDLKDAVSSGLMDEIALLRVSMRRLFESASREPEQSRKMWAETVQVISSSASRLASLLRTQKDLGGSQEWETLRLLYEVLEEVNQDIALK